ncbi:LptF/LptG family permease [Joostella atrarenae]|uniref:LptF/LptG family permease n=2 Tax=Joostella atrarenae TaxID=679257 RepID=A0ABS9J7A1_9FLAO|nr:LptF/LptG family permease [Joostella atrarenae]MCF8716311.1 LptF/LptG family permease [Joostella atrarenae]
MKILDRYILSRFLYNFISSFVILMLIFIFQAIWFFIDEFAGKDIDLAIVGKFLFYYSPNLVPNVLPLTVLLASIMTFGSLAENYEFAAMKASGISLYRAMRGLIVFIFFLSIGTFFFANDIIPAAEYKSYNLRRNIAQMKPAMAISEGAFSTVGEDFSIKVDEKHGDNDNLLDNVIIHQLSDGNINNKVIKSVDGELVSSENSNILQLILKNGNYYEDLKAESRDKRDNYPHAKASFDRYTIFMDLSELNNVDLEEEKVKNTFKMLNVTELDYAIDSIKKDNKKIYTNFGENVYKRTGAANLKITPTKAKKPDNNKDKVVISAEEKEKLHALITENSDSIITIFEDYRQNQLVDMALNTVKNTTSTLEGKKWDLNRRLKLYNHHILSLHQKYALAFACFILFFVGAPLGAIIRKGGLGLPMVLAIGLFLTYHFIGIFAKNYAEDGSIPPVIGAWVATGIMLPLGIFLTRRATADKALFETNFSFKNVGKLFSFLKKKKSKVEEKGAKSI